jgi:hypothetical protein
MRHSNNSSRRPWRRLVAAAAFILISVLWSTVRLPVLDEGIGIAHSGLQRIGVLAPALGRAGEVWVGFGLMVGGGIVLSLWRHFPTDKQTKMALTGSATLLIAVGIALALDATIGEHEAPIHGESIAEVRRGRHVHRVGRHTRKRRAHRRSNAAPSTSAGGASQSQRPRPAVAPTSPTHTPSAAGGGTGSGTSSSGSGSGSGNGDGNTITLDKQTNQSAQSGSTTGANSASGDATNSNTESVNISIG